MTQRKNELPTRFGANPLHCQERGTAHTHQPCVMQPKMATPSRMQKPPASPLVYRPQPVPKVLQTKMSSGQQSQSVQPKRQPVAPPVYRPQPKKIVQPKMAAVAKERKSSQTPPVYRPQPTPRSLQKKSSQTDGSKPAPYNQVKPPGQQPPRREPARTLNQQAGQVSNHSGSRVIQGRAAVEANPMGQRAAISHQRSSAVQGRPGTGRSSVVQRVMMKGDTPVSEQQFAADAQITRAAGGINPYKLPVHQSFLRHVYTYYKFVKAHETTAIGTALRAYWKSLTKGYEFLTQDAGLLGKFDKFQSSDANLKRRKFIEQHRDSKEYLVIFRGATATQADKIMTEQTMGGAKSAGKNLPAPSEEAAAKQTGLNIKQTSEGAIEEWSRKWGGLTGFSSGGVMLMALVPRSSVATTGLEYGEMGATGFAAQPLMAVAVYSTGMQSFVSGGDKLYTAARYVFDRAMGVPDKTGQSVNVQSVGVGGADKFFT